MKRLIQSFIKGVSIILWLFLLTLPTATQARSGSKKPVMPVKQSLQCVAFNPYVDQFNPDYGPHPDKAKIEQLLDILIKQTPFRCIMTYGVLNGLDATFSAAAARGIKVVAILWLDKDIAVNSSSIAKGIELARNYSDTIIKLSCGSEVRTRNGYSLDNEIMRCLDALREAKVLQPVTTIDTWWEWCDRASPCRKTRFTDKVDWIGINVFPWWENIYAGATHCIPAEKAADFHLARLNDMRQTYPGKNVVITEFGWPYGSENGVDAKAYNDGHCGIANRKNQAMVIGETLAKLAAQQAEGFVFEAFSEDWKKPHEGEIGGAWGLCHSEPPYDCPPGLIKSILPNPPH